MDNFKEGMILRIYCENFLTYNNVECRPCAKLNVIIGPNGTGKSSLVNAIVLGLGGKTDVIGRAKSLSAFVKRGCETAKIEIELYSEPRNYIVGHIFNLENKSCWTINGESVTKKQVEQVIKTLNIQVDNLCQFLPQDKVQDFAKMDSKQLLENTLKTIGSKEIISLHDSLKELRSKETSLDSTTKAMGKQLASEKTKISRLESEVKAIKEREEIINSAKFLEKKKAWVEFENVEKQHKQILEDKKNAVEIKDKAERDLIPFRRVITKIQEDIKKYEKDMSKEIRSSAANASAVNTKLEDSKRAKHDISSIDNQLKHKLEDRKRREKKIKDLQDEIGRLKTLVNPAKEKELADASKALLPDISNRTAEVASIQSRIQETQEQMAEVKRNISRAEGALEREMSAANQKMNVMQHRHRDAYRAYEWLQQNRDKFKHNIYGPIALEINCGDRAAKFAEFVIPQRDLVAFVCEDKDDMNNFMRTVRDSMRMKINTVLAPPNFDSPVSQNFPQRQPIESLKQFGFWSYVMDQIEGPNPVLNYLCHAYKLHTIPLGDRKTNNMRDKIPNHINSYFSDSQHFSVKVSKYSNEKSSRVVPVRESFLLAGSVDTGRIEEFRNAVAAEEENLRALGSTMERCRGKLAEVERKMNELRSEKRNVDQELMTLRQGRSKLAMRSEELQTIAEEAAGDNGPEADKADADRRKCKIIAAACKVQFEIKKCLQSYQASVRKNMLSRLKVTAAQRLLSRKQRDCEELTKKVNDSKRLLDNVDENLRRAKRDSVRARELALAQTDGLSPGEAAFEHRYREKFNQMPNDADALDAEIAGLEARSDCLGDGRSSVLEDYEKTKMLIQRLEKEVASPQQRLESIKGEMKEKRSQWMPMVLSLIERINANFTRYFSEMACAGEVSLELPEHRDEYAKYGICIKVQFRDVGGLQKLGPHTQSGGERAVSTAIYMLSLQQLTTVPFRCVDEINQGMDEFNERIVFKLMVKTVEHSNSAQCFLLTPKVLHLLEYSEYVRVHCIYSGLVSLSRTEFNVTKYLEKIGGGRQRESLKRKHSNESDSD